MTVKLMTSRVVKGTWLHTGVLWRLKGVQKVGSISFNLAVTLPVVDITFHQSGQDNYKLLDKSNITTHLVLSIYHHRELFAIRS